jgi:tetratricopeptide (TPR) repeat protein
LKKIAFVILSISLITLIWVLSSCSTEKNTAITRTYHNTTAKFNVYFNGNEAFRSGVKRAEQSYTDNYVQVLPVFVVSTEEASSTAKGDMDKAIKKASKAIKYHSIKAKPKKKSGKLTPKDIEFYNQNEYCKWIDDSYLLMGKAYLIQKDYYQARQNFEYMLSQFPKDKTQYEAKIWLARTYAENRQYKKAKEMFDLIDADREFPKKHKGEFAAAYADYFLKQNLYEDAIEKLKLAIKHTKKKKYRVRYKYILAQVYEKVGNIKAASEMYGEVIKMNPDYEMEFNARINMARNYAGGGNVKDVKKSLRKMLRDDKNIEYQDQIYYALGEIDYRDGNIPEAIKNYKLSSETSIYNDFQKAISCMKLGEIYFSEKEYIKSQNYYDTCMTYLPYDFDGYEEIRTLSRNLNELAIHLITIQTEDSLQKIAEMPDGERNKLIDKLIAQVVEEERKQQEMERLQMQDSYLFDQRRGRNPDINAPQGGSWYFYNPAQLSFGQNEFRKKWGNRKNEDHWRRKNKSIMTEFDEELADTDSVGGDRTQSSKITDNKKREYYLQDLPVNDSLMAESHQRILEALYNAARVYQEKFEAYPEAIDHYKELNTRYPENEYLLLSYYNLYFLNKLLNNNSEMNTYKNLVISKFPDSHYAKLLKNPNYLKELEAQRKADIDYYMKTYDAYANDDCDIVKRNSQEYLNREDFQEELIPKFDYLQVLCVGKTLDTTTFKLALVEFMSNYPNDDLYNSAQDILAYFGTTNIELLIADLASRPDVEKPERIYNENDTSSIESISPEQMYSIDETAPHYYVIYVNTENVDMKRLSFEVRNFNIFTFNLRTFNVVNIMFDDKHELVTVRTFDNQRQSINYKRMISNNPDVFGRLNEKDYIQFTISEENYQTLRKNKNLNAYLKFYLENYENK